jgi:hypothetical protein
VEQTALRNAAFLPELTAMTVAEREAIDSDNAKIEGAKKGIAKQRVVEEVFERRRNFALDYEKKANKSCKVELKGRKGERLKMNSSPWWTSMDLRLKHRQLGTG